MGRSFWVVLAVIVAVFLGVYANSNKDQSTSSSDKYSNKNLLEVKESDHVRGASTKDVTLIEYGDFQCPACKAYHPLVKQLEAEYGDQIKVVFRNFPIDSAHPKARAAHRAAEAASIQGKFWEMHDRLYETQDSWKDASNASKEFESFASDLGLNIDQFKADVASEKVNSIINADATSGSDLGVKSTPTFFLNGKQITNPTDYASFKKLIDNEITAKNPAQPSSETKPAETAPASTEAPVAQ